MRAQIFALLTAAAWGIGGYFEKRGLLLGNLPPQVGITIRTAVALIILAAVSAPQWKTILEAGPKSLFYIVRFSKQGPSLCSTLLSEGEY